MDNEHLFPPAYPVSPFDVVKSPGLPRSRGMDHRHLSELYVTAFAAEPMRSHADMLARQAEACVDTFRPGQAMDMRYEFERLAWNGVFCALFGTEAPPDPEIARPILKAAKLKFTVASMPGGTALLKLPLPFLVRALRAAKKLDPYAYAAIQRAGDPQHPGHDAVSHFVNATRQGLANWSFKDDREIRDEAYTMLFSAYEAPVIALVYSVYYLSRNPEARERLEQEADEVAGRRPLRGRGLRQIPVRPSGVPGTAPHSIPRDHLGAQDRCAGRRDRRLSHPPPNLGPRRCRRAPLAQRLLGRQRLAVPARTMAAGVPARSVRMPRARVRRVQPGAARLPRR